MFVPYSPASAPGRKYTLTAEPSGAQGVRLGELSNSRHQENDVLTGY
jgi:hypothetical protein